MTLLWISYGALITNIAFIWYHTRCIKKSRADIETCFNFLNENAKLLLELVDEVPPEYQPIVMAKFEGLLKNSKILITILD